MNGRWVTTTEDSPWVDQTLPEMHAPTEIPDLIIDITTPLQIVEGFGGSFNELGWDALAILDTAQRDEVMRALFAPGYGTSLSLCRMPIGANDFSRDWYSYDETEDDFALAHFSIERDRETLIPYIRDAQRYQPDLRIWASPWSPPTWMKTNGHYACAPANPLLGEIDNSINVDQIRREGTDTMRQDDEYLAAYARYFGRFVDAYDAEGIRVGMVMPQNEFNSAHPFPSCTWTPQGLTRFIRHLGPVMTERGVDIFLGTLERGNEELLEDALSDPVAGPAIAGAGFQWAGRGAIAGTGSRHPRLRLYQTEQECGTGSNDWVYARYAFTMLRHFLTNGANAYMYWNLALQEGGRSTWGWAQNSLVVVDPERAEYRFTHEYWVLRHVSEFVQTGAHLLEVVTISGHDKILAFRNPDGGLVLVVHNDMRTPQRVQAMIGADVLDVLLPADSFNTLTIPAPT